MKESRDYELKSLELVTKRKLGECRTYFDEIDAELAQQGFTTVRELAFQYIEM
ncbi:hypothetical protein J4423_04290 [Candidatus Pacearchaeota archaeon]|nr:hypothetical protein [Candidatus Pacearchaeota archaeon]